MSSNSYLKGNIIKNIVVLIIAGLAYPFIANALPIKSDQMGNFLLIISMLLVTVCFANFAFTYEKTQLKTSSGKLFAHCTTGLFMLLTVLLLESIVLTTNIVYPSFHIIILVFSILLYIGIILYDFWDLMRA